MEGTCLSPALTRMVGTVKALVSFQEGSEPLQELTEVEVGAKQVERTAEALAAEIAEDEWQQAEVWKEGSMLPTLYLAPDGTGMPMRVEELQGRVAYRNGVTPSTHCELFPTTPQTLT